MERAMARRLLAAVLLVASTPGVMAVEARLAERTPIYTEPGDGDPADWLDAGGSVNLDFCQDNGWCQVSWFQSRRAFWTQEFYLQPQEPAEGFVGTINADVDLYDEPGGTVIGMLDAGARVEVSKCNDENWCRGADGGWFWGDFVDR